MQSQLPNVYYYRAGSRNEKPAAVEADVVIYGATPTGIMVLGQSAANAACLALERNITLNDLPYATLQAALLKAGPILAWPDSHNPRSSVAARMK